MRLQSPTTETIKAKADRYYKAQCKRIADERRAARELAAHSPAPPADPAPAPAKRKRATKKVTP